MFENKFMLQELTTALGVAQQLREFQKTIKDVEFKSLLADLQLALADVKVRCADLEEENIKLRTEIAEIIKKASAKQQLVFNGNIYNNGSDSYCPTCHDKDDKMIRLHRSNNSLYGNWHCNVCESFFN